MTNICPYCGEDAGRTELGHLRRSHPHHRPGTPYWIAWYAAGARRTEAGDTILGHYERTREAKRASLSKLHAWQRRRAADVRAANGDTTGPDGEDN